MKACLLMGFLGVLALSAADRPNVVFIWPPSKISDASRSEPDEANSCYRMTVDEFGTENRGKDRRDDVWMKPVIEQDPTPDDSAYRGFFISSARLSIGIENPGPTFELIHQD